MRLNNTILCIFLSFTFMMRFAQAAPCSDFNNALINGSFVIEHSATSEKKALIGLTLQGLPLSDSRRVALSENKFISVHDVYAIASPQFAANADSVQVRMLSRYDLIATVTIPTNPDLCFLLWQSSSNAQFVDLNRIFGQDAFGNLTLGSNNRLDSSTHMHFNRQSPAR